MKKNILISSWILAILVSGCATVATHDEAVATIKKPIENLPQNFKNQVGEKMKDDGWLKSFNDPKLVKLVDEALKKNPGIKIAEAKVEQARGLIQQSESKLKPTVGLAASYSDGEFYDGNNFYSGDNAGNLGVALSWELDVWGKLKTDVKRAEEKQAATLADYEYAKQSLAANVTKAWFSAISAKLQLNFANEVIKIQEKSLQIAKAKEKIGQGNAKDTHLAKAELAKAKDASSSAKAAYEDALRSLELLLGRYPSADIKTEDKLVANPPKFPTGVPSEILERRPDLRAMEHKVAQAFYMEKESELLHLPRFRFSLGAGINSLSEAVGSLAAGLFAPLYTGGKIEGKIATATAKQKEAIAQYAKVALRAFKEVEGTLSLEDILLKRAKYLKIAEEESYKAYKITKKEYEIGQGSLLDVLNVQKKWISAKIAKLDVKSKLLINRVNIYMALGGSFQTK